MTDDTTPQPSRTAGGSPVEPEPQSVAEFEPAPRWMVVTVYVLLYLFVQGTVYRIIWPEEERLLHYGLFFVATTIPTILIVRWWRGRKPSSPPAA